MSLNDVCVCVFAVPAVREGQSDDGVDQQACSDPAERREVQEVDPSPSTKLLGHHHVHSAAATETVCSLQVRDLRKSSLELGVEAPHSAG